MAKTRNSTLNKIAPIRFLTRAREFYMNALCECGGGADRGPGSAVMNCTVPQTTQLPRRNKFGSSKEIDNADLQDLVRLLSRRKGGGATVDVDLEGNLVWTKPAAMETSYGGGVGRIGRIDEDKPCCFNEVDVNKICYSGSGSGTGSCNASNRGRNIDY